MVENTRHRLMKLKLTKVQSSPIQNNETFEEPESAKLPSMKTGLGKKKFLSPEITNESPDNCDSEDKR